MAIHPNINQRRRLSLAKLAPILTFSVIAVFCIHACSSARDRSIKDWEAYEWEMEKTDSASALRWTSYSRKVRGSKFKEYKIIGELTVSPAEAIRALRERTENSQKYLQEHEGFVQVLSSSPEEALVYSVYNLPFPFRDRSMCERFEFSADRVTGTHTITWKQDWDAAPTEEKNIVRMPVARGSWEFTPIGENRCRATYMVRAEPGGRIPAWMVNPTVSKELVRELEDIEEIAATLRKHLSSSDDN